MAVTLVIFMSELGFLGFCGGFLGFRVGVVSFRAKGGISVDLVEILHFASLRSE